MVAADDAPLALEKLQEGFMGLRSRPLGEWLASGWVTVVVGCGRCQVDCDCGQRRRVRGAGCTLLSDWATGAGRWAVVSRRRPWPGERARICGFSNSGASVWVVVGLVAWV